MAIAVQQMDPAAHLPLILGVLRRLEVATVIDRLISPYPAHVLSCGRGGEALVPAILVGDHALYKVGKRLAMGWWRCSMLCRVEVTRLCAPVISIVVCELERHPQRLEFEKDGILVTTKDIRQDRSRTMVNDMP